MPRTGLAPFKTQTRGPVPMERKKAPMPMMADGGGFGAPPPIGDDSAPPDMSAPPPPEPDPAAAGGSTIRPESVNYHDEAQSCSACQYMDDGSQCAVLNMQVSPDGGCTAFEAKGAGGDDEQSEPMPDDESMEGEGAPQ